MKLKQRVALLGPGCEPNTKVQIASGYIVGLGHSIDSRDGTHAFYTVELDAGFYNPMGNIWISQIVVNRNSEDLIPLPLESASECL